MNDDQRKQTSILVLHEWQADPATGRLTRDGESRSLEPKVAALLFLLAGKPGRVFSRAEILAALWPGVTVGEDTLARTVFKLRRALDDAAGAPRFIETIPKRGYRLLVDGVAADERAVLARRADEFYFQFTRADNEAAIALHERAFAADGNDIAALAGLANGYAQRAIRYLGTAPRGTLREALDAGVLDGAEAQGILAQARAYADAALALAPDDPRALKALGLVASAQGRFGEAARLYDRVLAADRHAWGVLINLADIDDIEGRPAAALRRLESAFEAMTQVYDRDAVRVRPWYARLSVLIAERHAALGQAGPAEDWYRRALVHAPVDEAATAGLAGILAARGDTEAARALCRELVARIGPCPLCAPFLDAQ